MGKTQMSQKFNSYDDYKLYGEKFWILSLILFAVNGFLLGALRISVSDNCAIPTRLIFLILVILYIKILGTWIRTLNKLLNGVSKKYLRKTTWSVIIYWGVIILSVLISGGIKETDLIVCSGIIVGEGILFLLIRGFYYMDIMERYHPRAISMDSYPIDLYSADEKKRQISDNLDKIQETTHNTEVLKALDLRRAMVLIIVHVEVPIFTMFNLGCLGLIK